MSKVSYDLETITFKIIYIPNGEYLKFENNSTKFKIDKKEINTWINNRFLPFFNDQAPAPFIRNQFLLLNNLPDDTNYTIEQFEFIYD